MAKLLRPCNGLPPQTAQQYDEMILRIRAMARVMERPSGNHLRGLTRNTYRSISRLYTLLGEAEEHGGAPSAPESSESIADDGQSDESNEENPQDITNVRMISTEEDGSENQQPEPAAVQQPAEVLSVVSGTSTSLHV